MSEHIHDFFIEDGPEKHFHKVIALHEARNSPWENLKHMVPFLPRGWFELSQLSPEDRVDFTRDYWLSTLPFGGDSQLEKRFEEFFETVEEVGIYITQLKKEGPFDVHMVYSLKNEAGFFQGQPPLTEEFLQILLNRFGNIPFPPDYLAFLRIHDGFSKYTDTGLIKSRDMAQIYQRLQHLLSEEILVTPDGQVVNPENLIPFYESFGLHCYQCFYTDWYPAEEMGNVYFSEHDRSLSNFLDPLALEENLAFPTFLTWLIFYLEDIWHFSNDH